MHYRMTQWSAAPAVTAAQKVPASVKHIFLKASGVAFMSVRGTLFFSAGAYCSTVTIADSMNDSSASGRILMD